MILPAMLSKAELTSAMPKQAVATTLSSAQWVLSWAPSVGWARGFHWSSRPHSRSLVWALTSSLPVKPLAIGLTLALAALNVIGAKELGGLQRILVTVLLAVLGFFIAQGLYFVAGRPEATQTLSEMGPMFSSGLEGFMATVGLVFVSHAGLTKVSSMAEEVENPDRTIPLGMILSIGVATVVYCVGVAVMMWVLDPQVSNRPHLVGAAAVLFDWMPEGLGAGLAVTWRLRVHRKCGNHVCISLPAGHGTTVCYRVC